MTNTYGVKKDATKMKGICDSCYLYRLVVPGRPVGFSSKASKRLKSYLTIGPKGSSANILVTPVISMEFKKSASQEEVSCQLAFVLDAIMNQWKSIGVRLDGKLETAAFGLTVELDHGCFHLYGLSWTGDENVRVT